MNKNGNGNDKATPKSISLYPHEWEQWESLGNGRSDAARYLLEAAGALHDLDEMMSKISRLLISELNGKVTRREALDRIKALALTYAPDARIYTTGGKK